MQPENLDLNEITEARRRGLEQTLRTISVEELKGMEETLFAYPGHPWRAPFLEFLAQNPSETFYHGKTPDRIEIIYCHAKDIGFWFIRGSAMGRLQESGLAILAEIVGKRH